MDIFHEFRAETTASNTRKHLYNERQRYWITIRYRKSWLYKCIVSMGIIFSLILCIISFIIDRFYIRAMLFSYFTAHSIQSVVILVYWIQNLSSHYKRVKIKLRYIQYIWSIIVVELSISLNTFVIHEW